MHFTGIDTHTVDMADLVVVDHGTHLVIVKDRLGRVGDTIDEYGLLSAMRKGGTTSKRVLFVHRSLVQE